MYDNCNEMLRLITNFIFVAFAFTYAADASIIYCQDKVFELRSDGTAWVRSDKNEFGNYHLSRKNEIRNKNRWVYKTEGENILLFRKKLFGFGKPYETPKYIVNKKHLETVVYFMGRLAKDLDPDELSYFCWYHQRLSMKQRNEIVDKISGKIETYRFIEVGKKWVKRPETIRFSADLNAANVPLRVRIWGKNFNKLKRYDWEGGSVELVAEDGEMLRVYFSQNPTGILKWSSLPTEYAYTFCKKAPWKKIDNKLSHCKRYVVKL